VNVDVGGAPVSVVMMDPAQLVNFTVTFATQTGGQFFELWAQSNESCVLNATWFAPKNPQPIPIPMDLYANRQCLKIS
jgi:hypothetical protein